VRGEKGDPGEAGPQGAEGVLPVVSVYKGGEVYYRGNVVTHLGATFQARKDTGRTPPHEDWICLAMAGRDAVSPVIRGTYVENAEYAQHHVVALGGSSFIAKCDAPGACPGDDWQLIASAGKPGKPGPPGPAGPAGQAGAAGPAGPKGADAFVTKGYRADRKAYALVPVNAYGIEGEPIPLRELFEQFHNEMR
jgi:hypothetical protein